MVATPTGGTSSSPSSPMSPGGSQRLMLTLDQVGQNTVLNIFMVPIPALQNQKHEIFHIEYGTAPQGSEGLAPLTVIPLRTNHK